MTNSDADLADRYLARLAAALACRYGGSIGDGARVEALLRVALAQIRDDITAGGPVRVPELGTFEAVASPLAGSRTLIYRATDDLLAAVDGRAAA